MRKTAVGGGLLGALLALGIAAGAARAADIVDTAAKNDQFKTLVAAVKAASLVETLKGTGPFTVFAPTDAAFAKLPRGTVEALLKPENKQKLVAVLTYHVLPGKVTAEDAMKLRDGTQVATINGAKVTVRSPGNHVRINNARVTAADVMADNGVIHVIDRVLLPPSGK